MTFNQVLQDIEKMQGILLRSIRAGAELTIEEVDRENRRVVLRSANGTGRSRPFAELERVWKALCTTAAVHVDSVLGGSGSSRNQPETILANLPYVEWFRHARKKHLCLVEEPSHDYGTLKQMDELAAEGLRSKVALVVRDAGSPRATQLVVVSGDVREHAEVLESITGVKGRPRGQGAYEFVWDSCELLVVGESATDGEVPPGTYLVLARHAGTEGKRVQIAGAQYWLQSRDGLCLLYADQARKAVYPLPR